MKKIFLNLSGMSLLVVNSMFVNAQFAANEVRPAGKFTVYRKTGATNPSGFTDRVNPGVIRSFIKNYPGVSNEKWFELRDGFVAMFNLNNMDYQVAYDKKGNWIHTIRSYDENELPPGVRHVVKSGYYDYAIGLVQEIQTPVDQVSYVIQLSGKTDLIKLSFSDGEIQVLQKFRKSE